MDIFKSIKAKNVTLPYTTIHPKTKYVMEVKTVVVSSKILIGRILFVIYELEK